MLLATMPPGAQRDKALADLDAKTEKDRAAAVAEQQPKLGRQTLREIFGTPGQPAFQLAHAETKTPLPARILAGPEVSFQTDARAELFRWLTAGEQPPLARV